MPTSKDFRGSGSHRQLFRPYCSPPAWHSHWVNEPGKLASQKPLTAEKQSIRRQLYTTHVGAVGWELHSSSTMTCMGKVDHQLPVNQSKGTHTPTHGLAITSRMCTAISCRRAAMGSGFAHTGAQQHGMAIGQ